MMPSASNVANSARVYSSFSLESCRTRSRRGKEAVVEITCEYAAKFAPISVARCKRFGNCLSIFSTYGSCVIRVCTVEELVFGSGVSGTMSVKDASERPSSPQSMNS